MRGNITRRGKSSWRLKFDVGLDPATGKRQTRFATVRGRRQDAEKELTRLLREADAGTLVEPSAMTVAEYMRNWIVGAHNLTPKTAERFRHLIEQQIVPHLGNHPLQKLKPAHVADWHSTILKAGGKGGRPLSPSTVRQAHRVLHLALAHAARVETVSRNVAGSVKPPEARKKEIECLRMDEVADVLGRLQGHPLLPIVALALATGLRRGELLALRWCDVDLDGSTLRVERSLEETKAGLRFKEPKTEHGRRSISLPGMALDALRTHRKAQLEQRMALGQGRAEPDALVFSEIEGGPISPLKVSGQWRTVVQSLKLPKVSFHGLRHSHASALLASGVDVLTVSRRLGHASPVVTLGIYAHIVTNTDEAAANAIENALRTPAKP